MSVTLNPTVTTNAAGSFFASSDGYTAGSMAVADPAALQKLQIGQVASGATGYLYGGVGLSVYNPITGSPSLAGSQLQLATALANLLGFAVWDQAAAGIQTPQSPAALFTAGQTMSFFGFGSGACIALPITNANAANLLNASGSDLTVLANVQLSWDYTNQVVIPYASTGGNAGAIPYDQIVDVSVGNCKVAVTATNYATWGVTSPGAGNAVWLETGSVVVLRI